MADQGSSWFIRNRGKVLGPFGWTELESMRNRGQLARFHEVSQDRHTWISAASVPELFPGSEARQPQALGASNLAVEDFQEIPVVVSPAGPDGSASWFYSRGGTHQGPVTYQDLQRMAAQSEIGPDTLVWRSGMADWVPCRQFPDFSFAGQGTQSSAPASPHTQPHSAFAAPSYAQVPLRTSGLAVASLVLGILFLCGIGSLLATIFGAVALSQISRSNGTLTGRGMAIAGLVLGIVGLGFVAFLVFTGMLPGFAASVQPRL